MIVTGAVMANKCSGCMNKFKRFEKPNLCPGCHKSFCSICLPVSKKPATHPPPRQTCVYCSRQQKEANKSEEAEILDNFQERFYKHAHTEPPIQTKVRLDAAKLQVHDKRSEAPRLSEQDKQLEERLRKLKESHKTAGPKYSEDEIKEKLSHLRGEDSSNPVGTSHDVPTTGHGSSKTQFEQAQDLFKEASEEAKLDERLANANQKRDANLFNRLQALKGKETSTQGQDADIQGFLENMDIQIGDDDDPEQLLQDLREYQKREEGLLSAKVKPQSEDPTDADPSLISPYPILPGGVTQSMEGQAREGEIAKLMDLTAQEIKEDERREVDEKTFIEKTSDRLVKLRGEEDKERESDCVVRSKPHPVLDFSWDHFGSALIGGDPGALAARQLGITLSGEGEPKDDVEALLEQMRAEATLDTKLEVSGYGRYLEKEERPPPTKESGGHGGAGAAAAAAYFHGEEDDLPWCCICNNDATLRCYDCDDDLYCTRCFSEGHESFGLFDHRYGPFEPPSKTI